MKIAVIIPCLNEELTVARVVQDCLRHMPEASIFVLDNGSQDQTAECARAAGAQVIHSPLRGKGHVLRHAFRVLDADYYVMVDGDGTYRASEAKRLVAIAHSMNYEMVNGSRLESSSPDAYRPLHYLGNRMFTHAVRLLFGYPVQDLLTGFRVFSRRFTREVVLQSRGFEVETEMTVRAIAQGLAFCEVPIPYVERPQGSTSKLRTFRDGWKILMTIGRLLKVFQPHYFYQPLAALSFTAAALTTGVTQSTLGSLAALLVGLGFYFDSTLSLQRLRIQRRGEKAVPEAQPTKRAS
ncbi:MAG: glycosyltransferase [Bdellovibrionales bacterium]|nr:glycosyltransferase [Bdellovibrionales bacterium]